VQEFRWRLQRIKMLKKHCKPKTAKQLLSNRISKLKLPETA